MVAFNLSGDLDDMLNRHDYLVENGATCLMVNLNSVGISAVHHLAKHTVLPIHGHRNGWGMLSRSPVLGIEFPAYQKIWRLAGVDHMHTNGIRNKFCESDASVINSIKSCLMPFIGLKSPMPVLSSGQWAGQTVDTYEAIRKCRFNVSMWRWYRVSSRWHAGRSKKRNPGLGGSYATSITGRLCYA